MKNKNVIEELYFSYVKQKKDAEEIIIRNNDKIAEITKFLESIDDVDSDRKYFSPINTDSLYDGRIELEKKELSRLRLENEENLKLIDNFSLRINQFKEIIEDSELPDIESDSFKSIALSIQENERKRISSELHDVTVQNLVHLGHSLELVSMLIDQDPLRARLELETCSKSIKDTIDELRRIIFGIRPMSLDDLDLSTAIRDYVSNICIKYSDIDFDIDVDYFDVDKSFKLVVFRIITECINNSVKHSTSKNILLHVKNKNNNCCINVKDYGIGFNINEIDSNHFGISIMKERVKMVNGTININSSSEGTDINIVIPIR